MTNDPCWIAVLKHIHFLFETKTSSPNVIDPILTRPNTPPLGVITNIHPNGDISNDTWPNRGCFQYISPSIIPSFPISYWLYPLVVQHSNWQFPIYSWIFPAINMSKADFLEGFSSCTKDGAVKLMVAIRGLNTGKASYGDGGLLLDLVRATVHQLQWIT